MEYCARTFLRSAIVRAMLSINRSLHLPTVIWFAIMTIALAHPDCNFTGGLEYPESVGIDCASTLCVRKCCPLNQVFQNKSCIPSSHGDFLKFFPGLSANNSVTSLSYSPSSSSHLLFGYFKPMYFLQRNKFTISRNWSIWNLSTKKSRNFTELCFDMDPATDELIAWICLSQGTEVQEQKIGLRQRLYAIGMLLSVICLSFTFLVYCSPELNNMHGRCLRQYMFSLISVYLLMIVITLRFIAPKNKSFCFLSAVAVQFLLLSSFFWLNVMCFDLWRTFRSSVKISQSKQRFTNYCLYAWGCSSICTAICLVIDFLPGIPEWVVRPMIADQTCWLEPDARTYYFYMPITFVIISNALMFFSTSYRIVQHQATNSQYLKKTNDSTSNACQIQRLSICFKLFITMGVIWITEVISWYVKNPQALWYVPDTLNALQGLLVFLIFACKRRMWHELKRKFCSERFTAAESSLYTPSTSITSIKDKSINLVQIRSSSLTTDDYK